MMKLFSRSVIAACTLLSLGSPSASGQVVAACRGDGLLCLDQGWTDAQRAMWYTMSQGSRLLPLSWARHLRTADDSRPFFGAAHLGALGYLDNPVSATNPEGLPVGFAVDQNPADAPQLMCDRFPAMCAAGTMRAPWLGLNCAACHTTEITYQGRRLRIEGAPTLADFDGLVNGLQAALVATANDGARLRRLALDLGAATPRDVESLNRQLREQIAWMEGLRRVNDGAVAAGPGRLDAQGHILAKVAAVNGGGPPPEDFRADAPASYPFIWNTHQQDKLQWNGIAGAELKLNVFSRNTDVGALIRNISEVIGVFAQIEADKPGITYRSSVRLIPIVSLERVLERLQSPVWPEGVLGPLDRGRVAAGAPLYAAHCQQCHQPLAAGDQQSPAPIRMEPIESAGTDLFLACNTFLRTADAGSMAGKKMFGVAGARIERTDVAHKMLVNAASGVILRQWRELLASVVTDLVPRPLESVIRERDLSGLEVLPGVTDPVRRERARRCLAAGAQELLAYKARPLNGIWATAPYLHNGSVPTLYDLLLPARLRNTVPAGVPVPDPAGPLRPERFTLGNRAFDPVKVGFAEGAPDSTWTFNVRDAAGAPIPGNSNAGHDYGNASLSEEDRLNLLEYLKSL